MTDVELTKSWKRKMVTILMHVTGIFIIYFLPEIVMNIGDPRHDTIPTGVYVKTIVYIAVFYVNYLVLFDRCINKPHSALRFVGYNVVLFVVAMSIIYVAWELIASNQPVHSEYPPVANLSANASDPTEFKVGEEGHWAMSFTRFLRDAIILILTITLSLAIKFSNKWVATERQREAQRATQREEELKSLRSQLNPHFLFNTLNSIYALIDICPETAKHAVHELSHMLRYVLYENPSTVTLKQELKFVDSYVSLMKMRLKQDVKMNVTLNSNGHDNMLIAPLLFVTIIENVFKHGDITNPSKPIEIAITAENDVVKCHTFNYVLPSDKKTEGIGLNNLQRRLSLLYGDNAILEVNRSSDTFTVDLRINVKN